MSQNTNPEIAQNTNVQSENPNNEVNMTDQKVVEAASVEQKPMNKKQKREAKRAARLAAAAEAPAAEQKGTRKQAEKKEKSEAKPKERDKARIARFSGVAEAKDSMYAVLAGCVDKKPEDLNQVERTALALTLIPADSTIEWKELIERYNSALLDKSMTASTRSDGTTGPKDDQPKGFNLRNQLWRAEHVDKNPLRIIRGQKYMNLKAHSNDGILRGRLEGFTLLPSTFKMLAESQELVSKLHARFFRKQK